MNILGLFGIVDIIIVLIFIIMLLIGWKRGFLEHFLKIANALLGLVFALLFAVRFANFIGPLFFNDLIQPKIYENVITSDAISSINADSLEEGIANVLKEVGIPGFLSDVISKGVANNADVTAAELQEQVATAISQQITNVIVIVIAFFILLIGTTILFWILKLVLRVLRTNTLFRVIDGVFGVVFMTMVFFLFIYTLLLILSLLLKMPQFENFANFIVEDMQLETDSFRLSKYLYENNVIANIFRILF